MFGLHAKLSQRQPDPKRIEHVQLISRRGYTVRIVSDANVQQTKQDNPSEDEEDDILFARCHSSSVARRGGHGVQDYRVGKAFPPQYWLGRALIVPFERAVWLHMALRDAVGQWLHLFDEQSDIVWNDVAMDNFFSSLNAERFGKKIE